MDPQRLAEIDAVFAAALELEAGERPSFLDRRCSGDAPLRREVDLLLARADRLEDTLFAQVQSVAAAAVAAGPADELAAGETVGAYRLVRRLGAGGMGVVYLAERVDGTFEKRVALKVLRGTMTATQKAVQRFEQERQILAGLSHPSIAHLLDGGVDRRGLPYLVMELVDGNPIDRWCDERRLDVAARIALVVEVAAAVQAAHRNLVVHRDLKPSNVLVDAAGRVKLLDFGIAKLLEEGDGALTVTQARALTPTYASPEQIQGHPITTAADVYQLGLLLYEMATGHRPQAGAAGSIADLIERICLREPPPPSRVVHSAADGRSPEELAALRGSTPAKLERALRPEVDAVVACALAKDPERRYPSANALAEELERFLGGRPVHARRPSLAFRLRRWAARNAALAAVAALAVLSLAGYAVTLTLQARALESQRERAEAEAAKATAVERFIVQLFAGSDPEAAGDRDVKARDLLTRGAARVEAELAGQPEVQARLWSALGQIQDSLGSGEEARRLLKRALAVQAGRPGEHVDGAETLHRLGVALRRHGQREEARRYLQESVDRLRRLLPADDPRLATALADLGVAKGFLGDFASAGADLAASLDIRRRNGARAEVAETLTSPGLIEVLQDDAVAAERYYRQALAGLRELHGERHVKVAGTLALLAETRRLQGDLEGALDLFTRALELHRDLLGAGHVEVGEDLSGIALINTLLDRYDRADELYAESLAILRPQVTADHPEILAAQQGLGALRVKQGRFVEAEELLGRSPPSVGGPLRQPLRLRRRHLRQGSRRHLPRRAVPRRRRLEDPRRHAGPWPDAGAHLRLGRHHVLRTRQHRGAPQDARWLRGQRPLLGLRRRPDQCPVHPQDHRYSDRRVLELPQPDEPAGPAGPGHDDVRGLSALTSRQGRPRSNVAQPGPPASYEVRRPSACGAPLRRRPRPPARARA
jgi:serine/threonine-protein kinase